MKTVLLLVVCTVGLAVFGHGESKLGPHGGYIRMPGAFHTELVEITDAFHVYLLDVQWKNPTIENSFLEVKVRKGEGLQSLRCSKQNDHFSCLKKGTPFKKVLVKASRLGQQGIEVVYDYPLELMPPAR